MILQWHSSRHGLLPFKLWVAGCLAIGYPYLSKSALGHSIGLPLNPLSMYQWWWSFCVKLASVDSPNNLLTRAYSFNSCYFRTPVRFFEKESRDIQKESYGISRIRIRSY